ncbi:glycosyltransferase [Agromyces sp. CCNWLW203]|uniref:glycosyltransferase n=1 Tax=Agromyces sp. CCNWLW203 TaxID=3112842 RepID=UPI002F969A5A
MNGDVDYKSIIRHNPWPSSSVAPAEVYREIPYRSLPPGAGYGPEDWIWNIDTAAAGIPHDVVTDSMFFYRVRERGGVNNRHGASILPRFDFDALRSALPVRVPDASAQGARSFSVRELGRRAYVTARPLVRRITSRLTPEERERIYRGARRVHHTVLRIPTEDSRAAAHIQNALREATEIEPAISWTAHHYDKLARWHTDDDGYTDALEYVLDAIGDRSDAIVAVPWVGIGGADLVSRNYATAIQSSARFRGKTTLLATHLPERTVHELIPEGVNFVQVPKTLDKMWPDLQRRFIAQIVVMTRPELLVSVNCFHLANALQLYGRQIADGTDVFATLFAFDRIEPGYPVNPITDDSQRAYLDDIAGIITDNSNTAALIEEILAVEPPVLQVHRQPALDTVPALARDTQAYNDVRFTHEDPLRVIWPHRIDTEKRPDTVAAIARMIQERNLPVQIDVWGSPVLSSDAKQRMRDLADAGVHYRGPYSGGLTALPIGEYHALLLTSQSEGLPLVLVQALLCGLPVVASGVGGVPDIIVDGRTGLLTEGPNDIEGFVTSLERLMESIELRRSLIEEGYAFAAAQHSWEAFQTTVNETLIGDGSSVRP